MLPQNFIKLTPKKGWFCSELHGIRMSHCVPWWMEEKPIAHIRNATSLYVNVYSNQTVS
jgi:hypothetical protein